MANAFTATSTPLAVSPPSAPDICRLYIYFVLLDGSPAQNVRLTAVNNFTPPFGNDQFMAEREKTVLSDVTGLATIDVVQGREVTMAISETNFTRTITAPLTSIENLLTVLGLTSDAFTVVRD